MSLIRTFHRNRAGSVPIVFGIAMFPMAAVTAVSVDYARATQARAQLQSAADSDRAEARQ